MQIIGDNVIKDIFTKLHELKKNDKLNKDNIIKEVYNLLPTVHQKEWDMDVQWDEDRLGYRKLNPNHVFTICYFDGKRTLLESAAMKNFPDLIEDFVKAGVNVDKTGNGKGTILLTIATIGWYEVIRELVRSGARLEAMDGGDYTVLHYTSANNMGFGDNNNVKIIEYLLEQKKLDVNVTDKEGQTPLHVAVANDYKEVVEILILNGANPLLKDTKGRTAADYASEEMKDFIKKEIDATAMKPPSTKLTEVTIESVKKEGQSMER